MAPTCQLCGSVGGVFKKGTMATAHLSVWERAAPPALTLMPDTSVSLCMPLVPCKLLSLCWSSEGVSLSKFRDGFFKKNCLGLQNYLPSTQPPLVIAAQKFGGLIFLALEPWDGELVGWNSLLPRYSPLNFYPPPMDVGSAHSVSPPLLPVWMDVVSLISQSSDFHSTEFLMILSDGCSVVQL